MFKLLVVVVAALVAAAVAIDRHSYGGHSEGLSYGSSEDAHAEIKSLYTDRNQKGFDYGYETTNHIKADASGDEHGNIHGNFEWVSPEGVHVAVKYEADENGYRPVSDAIPTPPPIPPAILKALEYIRTHPPYEEKEQRYGH